MTADGQRRRSVLARDGWDDGDMSAGDATKMERQRSTAAGETLEISLEPVTDPDRLGPLWTELEGRSDASFFQSWGWIGCWLRLLPPTCEPRVLTLRSAGRVQGLAILCRHRSVRRGVIASNGLHLNESGVPAYDQLTVEYNGVLAERGLRSTVVHAAAIWLAGRVPDWDELFLGGLDSEDRPAWEAALVAAGLRLLVRDHKRSDHVDLERVRRSAGSYLDTLSRNTRYQLRRALRLYEEAGACRYEPAASIAEGLEFLDELKRLHQAYWRRRGQPGAFSGVFFERFHRTLIAERFGRGEVELVRIRSGERPIGYLYNFVHNGWVYAYQSGFEYDDDPRYKPGLVSHGLAIEHHLKAGARLYDFMAGEGQHKRSLGSGTRELVWLVAQRPRMKYRLENALRAIKQRMTR